MDLEIANVVKKPQGTRYNLNNTNFKEKTKTQVKVYNKVTIATLDTNPG